MISVYFLLDFSSLIRVTPSGIGIMVSRFCRSYLASLPSSVARNTSSPTHLIHLKGSWLGNFELYMYAPLSVSTHSLPCVSWWMYHTFPLLSPFSPTLMSSMFRSSKVFPIDRMMYFPSSEVNHVAPFFNGYTWLTRRSMLNSSLNFCPTAKNWQKWVSYTQSLWSYVIHHTLLLQDGSIFSIRLVDRTSISSGLSLKV